MLRDLVRSEIGRREWMSLDGRAGYQWCVEGLFVSRKSVGNGDKVVGYVELN